MNARIATNADTTLPAFLETAWDSLGIDHDDMTERLESFNLGAEAEGHRMSILLDGKMVVAALGSTAAWTERGLGFNLNMVAVDMTREDRLDLLDRICLWSARLAVLEGRPIITFHPKTEMEFMYGRDMLGMTVEDAGIDMKTGKAEKVRGWGDCRAIIPRILERHPDW